MLIQGFKSFKHFFFNDLLFIEKRLNATMNQYSITLNDRCERSATLESINIKTIVKVPGKGKTRHSILQQAVMVVSARREKNGSDTPYHCPCSTKRLVTNIHITSNGTIYFSTGSGFASMQVYAANLESSKWLPLIEYGPIIIHRMLSMVHFNYFNGFFNSIFISDFLR